MYLLFGIQFSLDAYLPKPGWKGEGLGLPTGQGVLPSLRTGEWWREDVWGSGRKVGGGKKVEILIGIIYKVIEKRKKE